MTPSITLFISVVSYLFMGIVMYTWGGKSYRISNRALLNHSYRPYTNAYFYLSILFFALMCGLRYRCGADCESYAQGLERLIAGQSLSTYKEHDEFLFESIARIMAWLGVGRVFYMGVWAFLEIVFFYSALKTRNYLLPFIGLVLILGPHFCEWNNGLRQMIAACICVYAVVGIVDGKSIWSFFIWLIVAFFFHKSALIMIPFVSLKFYHLKPNIYISACIFLLCFYFGQSRIFEFAFKEAETVLSFLDYEGYANRFDNILTEEATITSYGPRRIVLLLSSLFIFFFCQKIDEHVKGDKFYRVSFLLFLIYTSASELFIGHTVLLLRPFLYLMPFLLICSAYLLYYLKSTKKRIWYIAAIVVFCSFSLLSSWASFSVPDEAELYKYIFLK